MNHALVAADAGEDAVEQTGGGGQQDARLSAPTFFSVLAAISQMKVAEQPHRRAYPPPRPAGGRVERPRVTGSRLYAFFRRRGVGEVLDQIACVASCGVLGQVRAQTRTRRRRRACRRTQASRWREACRRDGLSVVAARQRPRRMVSPTRGRRHGSTTTAVSSSVAGPLLPRSGRGWLAPNSQARRTHNRTLPGAARAPTRPAKETGTGGSTQIGATPARRRDSRTGRVGSSGAAFLTSLAQPGLDDRNSDTTGTDVRLPTMRRGSGPLGDRLPAGLGGGGSHRRKQVTSVDTWNPGGVAQRGALAQEPARCHTARHRRYRGKRRAGRRTRHEEGGQGCCQAKAHDDRGAAQGGRRADAQVLGVPPRGQGAGVTRRVRASLPSWSPHAGLDRTDRRLRSRIRTEDRGSEPTATRRQGPTSCVRVTAA